MPCKAEIQNSRDEPCDFFYHNFSLNLISVLFNARHLNLWDEFVLSISITELSIILLGTHSISSYIQMFHNIEIIAAIFSFVG